MQLISYQKNHQLSEEENMTQLIHEFFYENDIESCHREIWTLLTSYFPVTMESCRWRGIEVILFTSVSNCSIFLNICRHVRQKQIRKWVTDIETAIHKDYPFG